MSKFYAALGAVLTALFIAGASYIVGDLRGKQDAALVASQAKADTIRVAVTKAETVFVAKADTFTRWRTKTVTLRDTLLRHITDTVLVKQFVAASDTALHACSEVIVSCDTIRARYAALAKQDSTTQQLLRKQQPGFWAELKSSCGIGAGYGLKGGDAMLGCIVVHLP